MRKSRIGRLSNIITIQAATLTPDGAGGNTEVWVNASDVWAEALPARSYRDIDAQQSKVFADVVFRVREQTSVSKKNRVLYDGRVCVIEGIRDWEQDREFKFIDTTYSNEDTAASGSGGGATVLDGLGTKYLTVVEGTTIQDDALINQTLVNIYRNGIALQIITSGTPTGSQVLFDSTSGTFTFGLSLILTEYIYVIYHG